MDAILGILTNGGVQSVGNFLFGLLVKYHPAWAASVRNRLIPFLNTLINFILNVAGGAAGVGIAHAATGSAGGTPLVTGLLLSLAGAVKSTAFAWLFQELYARHVLPAKPAYSLS